MLPGPGRAPDPQQCLGVRSQADPSGLSWGQAHADCRAPIRGGGGGWDLVTAGAEVPRGCGRTLLEQDRLRFPSHSLTHSLLAAAQAGGIAPKEVAARTLRLDAPLPASLLDLSAVCGRRSVGFPARISWLFHTCARAKEEHSWRVGGHVCRFGPCMYVQEQLCMRGGSLCISPLGCTCVTEARRERLGDTRKPGVAVGRQFPTEAGWL